MVPMKHEHCMRFDAPPADVYAGWDIEHGLEVAWPAGER